MILPDHHVSIASANEIFDMSKDFFRESNSSYYHYLRIYNDGRFALLGSDPFIVKYVHENYLKVMPLKNELHLHDTYTFFSTTVPAPGFGTKRYDEFAKISQEVYNVCSGLVIINKKLDYYEISCFNSEENDSSMIQYYFNNLDQLEKFTDAFKDKTSKLMNQLQQPHHIVTLSEYVGLLDTENSINAFTVLQNIIKEAELTKRELECLLLVVTGKPVKIIAQMMNISHRTVEAHIEKLRLKLDCRTKAELIAKYAFLNNQQTQPVEI